MAYANISIKKVEKNNTKENISHSIIKIIPKIYRFIYVLGELYNKSKIRSPLYGYNKIYAKNLSKFIEANKYDIVIATHLFPGHTLTFLKKAKKHTFYNDINRLCMYTFMAGT